ncbi:triglyceride lipase [Prunus dulcis]|uniref:Triglyceride lipase n=1 Tax=Prunus dulcis TaxID=3755 RepID=A0A4Y1QLD6_PRUDU|nr:triglyceride lipase [Prunus dulcis]
MQKKKLDYDRHNCKSITTLPAKFLLIASSPLAWNREIPYATPPLHLYENLLPFSTKLHICHFVPHCNSAMASLQTHHYNFQFHRCVSSLSPKLHGLQNPKLSLRFPISFSGKVRVTFRGNGKGRDGIYSLCCLCRAGSEVEKVSAEEGNERPPFDINLAVVLAGFAFEAYSSPPDNIGRREVDAADCKTVYLSESFVREIYDGELLVKLKKGLNLPAMDPWGTSDPYVVMQLDGQVVKSKVKWGTKEPTWNENFSFNIKQPPTINLQVAAWDANLVTPHKRMGNAGISLEGLCDGNSHDVLVELGGMGGGGKLHLEVNYKSFDEIDEGKMWWRRVPFVSDFLRKTGFEPALKMLAGSDTVQAREFVEYAFGQLKSFNNAYLLKNLISSSDGNNTEGTRKSNNSAGMSDVPSQMEGIAELSLNNTGFKEGSNSDDSNADNGGVENGYAPEPVKQLGEERQSNKNFWRNFANEINQNVVEKFGLPIPEKLKWDGFDLLNKVGLHSRKIAEASYIDSGLATPEGVDVDNDKISGPLSVSMIQSSLPDIKEVTRDLVRQTDSVLGTLMVLTAAVSQSNKEANLAGRSKIKEEDTSNVEDDALTYPINEKLASSQGAQEMKNSFLLQKVPWRLGRCLLLLWGIQVAIWCDSSRKRLVIAFRGTEQARWKDLRTDLMLAPAGLNPERIGGDFKEEVQRLSYLYTSQAAEDSDDLAEPLHKWHVYVTGHSLGGALSTLLALELSSSQLAKRGVISVTMYNFGSPRVGNKKFAEVYNEDNIELSGDGYQGDVIGEYTPDALISEFMKGEMELIEKILETEINIFSSIRDGTALMQHMEDFYYITLLENVRSNYQVAAARAVSDEQKNIKIS